eukprot:CAMPEP_0116855708 /NCGR_PEP_ID=MMETSP0418-20121206/19447_1 /TAXON_ID=1158023 /ORGANISM="Astrosyne radiata, Strain 13vi08-1A" /LENGTH=210 /DNA_ID=CAMNT_0004488909 /DNA_START=44 /DNA_END=676 /DNA_ORIENTATION=-
MTVRDNWIRPRSLIPRRNAGIPCRTCRRKRIGSAAVALQGHVYCIGGFHGQDNQDMSSIEQLNLIQLQKEESFPSLSVFQIHDSKTKSPDALLMEPKSKPRQNPYDLLGPPISTRSVVSTNKQSAVSTTAATTITTPSKQHDGKGQKSSSSYEVEILYYKRKQDFLEKMHVIRQRELDTLQETFDEQEKRIAEMEQQLQQLLQQKEQQQK